MQQLRLYDYAASGNCYKVRLLLAQLGRDYERVPIDIFGGDTLTDEYGAKNPMRTTPLLETEDGRFLPESAAILTYLAEGTPFLPTAAFERAEVVRWLIYEQTDVMWAVGGLRFRLQTGRFAADSAEAKERRTAGDEVLRLLDSHLGDRDFFVGAYSIADVAIYGYTHVAHEAGYELDEYPHVAAWLERVAAQPEYVNDLEPYPANAAVGAGRSLYD